MARCLRCQAGNEWIEGDAAPVLRRELSEEEVLKVLFKLRLEPKTIKALTYESGAYDVDCATQDLLDLVEAFRNIP